MSGQVLEFFYLKSSHPTFLRSSTISISPKRYIRLTQNTTKLKLTSIRNQRGIRKKTRRTISMINCKKLRLVVEFQINIVLLKNQQAIRYNQISGEYHGRNGIMGESSAFMYTCQFKI